MSRSIVFLNLLLLAGLVMGGMELRRRWKEARDREKVVLAVRPVSSSPTPPAALALPTTPQKLQPAQYSEVADRFLFARDRNPIVVIEKKPEPPPKVMPDFPKVYGVMDVGFGPTVFISIGGEKQQGHKIGDKIGDFILRAATQKEVTFEWEGKQITKLIDELRPKVASSQEVASNGPGGAPEAQRMNANVNSVPVAAPPSTPPKDVRPAPGQDIGMGRKGCIPGDNSPAGTVVDGYKKVSYAYAFGPICYWEQSR
jgi:hypothetical protein